MKIFDKSYVVVGKNIDLRAATSNDANFVYEMRSNEKKQLFSTKLMAILKTKNNG